MRWRTSFIVVMSLALTATVGSSALAQASSVNIVAGIEIYGRAVVGRLLHIDAKSNTNVTCLRRANTVTITDPTGATIVDERFVCHCDTYCRRYVPLNLAWLGAMPGPHTVVVVVDVDDIHAETNESDNVATEVIDVIPALPDLVARSLDVPISLEIGQTFTVSASVANAGVGEVAFGSRWLLGLEGLSSTDHRILGEQNNRLLEFEEEVLYRPLRVPFDLAPGRYELALEMDPNDRVMEGREDNNRVLRGPIQIVRSPLQITGLPLEMGRVDRPYDEDLEAVGDVGQVLWRVLDGALPPGLELTEAGRLSGVPTAMGIYAFELEVADPQRVTRQWTEMEILPPYDPLTMVTSHLPDATALFPYRTTLEAAGGLPPYVWTIDALPDGLTQDASGVIEGVPSMLGPSWVRLTVRDAIGGEVSQSISLVVRAEDPPVRLGPIELPPGWLDRPYCEREVVRFIALDGTPPLAWRQEELGVPGLTLADDGSLCGTPVAAGTFELGVMVSDALGRESSGRYRVVIDTLESGALDETTGGGCVCASARDRGSFAEWLVWVAALVLLSFARTRRRPNTLRHSSQMVEGSPDFISQGPG